MCTINLNEIIKDKTMPNAGARFYDLIVAHLKTCDRVVIDMTNVISLPSVMLNVSIGKYIEEHSVEDLKNKISFTNITKSQSVRLQEYIDKTNKNR